MKTKAYDILHSIQVVTAHSFGVEVLKNTFNTAHWHALKCLIGIDINQTVRHK